MGHHERGDTTLQFGVSVDVLHCPGSIIDPLYFLICPLGKWTDYSGYSTLPFSLFFKTGRRLLLIFETLFQDPVLYLGYLAKVYSAFPMCGDLELLSILFRAFEILVLILSIFFPSFPCSPFLFLSWHFPFPLSSFPLPSCSLFFLHLISPFFSFLFYSSFVSFVATKNFLLGLATLNRVRWLHKYQQYISSTELSSTI